jgi:ppGpp synthetase/RelA/SpoT-type nucleotidyltranferase
MREDEVRAEYVERLPRLGELRASLQAALRHLEALGADVTSRIKTWESVRDKLTRTNAHLVDISDLVGVRVVVPDIQTFLQTSDALRREFLVTEWTTQHLRMGESAAHFIVRAKALDGISAEIQVLTAAEAARRALEHELRYKIATGESPAREATGELTHALMQFEALIERPGVHEKRDVHGFINSHSFLLFPNPDAVTSEVPIGLGTEFRIDFLVQRPDGSYLLVEIENPQAALFTKSGDFSAALNHALRQVEDWQEWIEANLPTVERYFPGIRAPEAWVVIGRARGLADAEKRRLVRRNINMRGRVALRTYDDVLRDAGAYIRSIRRAIGEN